MASRINTIPNPLRVKPPGSVPSDPPYLGSVFLSRILGTSSCHLAPSPASSLFPHAVCTHQYAHPPLTIRGPCVRRLASTTTYSSSLRPTHLHVRRSTCRLSTPCILYPWYVLFTSSTLSRLLTLPPRSSYAARTHQYDHLGRGRWEYGELPDG